jgi:hypothetical protein
MGENINIRLQGSPVRTRRYGLNDGFAVDNNNPGAKGSGFGNESRNMLGWNMGQLDPANYLHCVSVGERLTDPGYPGNYEIDVCGVAMIRYGDSPITFHLGPSHQFRRNQFAVAENTMGVQIDHFFTPSCNRSGPLADF